MTLVEVLSRLLAVALLVGANAFFVASEFALVSSRDARLAGMADAGDRLARVARKARKDLNLYLSSCQIANFVYRGVSVITIKKGKTVSVRDYIFDLNDDFRSAWGEG